MARIGNLYGPDATFLGVPAADPDVLEEWAHARAVIIGAPFDGGTSHRPGARFGPQAIRTTDYLPHDGMRPSLALGLDPLVELGVVDLGDVEMPSGETERSLALLEDRVADGGAPGRHSDRPGRRPHDRPARRDRRRAPRGLRASLDDPLRRARRHRQHADGLAVRTRHADAPTHRIAAPVAATGSSRSACAATGPSPRRSTGWPTGGMRSFEMCEIVARGLDAVLDESLEIAMDDCDAVFLSVDVDVVDPGSAPGTGTPEPGVSRVASCSTRCAVSR